MTHDPYLDGLRREIAMLAADADIQIRSMPKGLSFAVLNLQDVDFMLEVMLGPRGRACMSPDQIAACGRLKEALTEIARGEPELSSFWTNEGLRNHPKWSSIRRAARSALCALDRREGPEWPPQV